MKTLFVHCYNCHSKETTPYDTENGFKLVKCAGCGLLYVTPRPTGAEISKATQIGQHGGNRILDVTGTYEKRAVKHYLSILNDIYGDYYQQSSGRTWLDIGCGHGEFLNALALFGPESLKMKGIEPNQHKAAAVRNRGLDVDTVIPHNHDETYDFISLLNVYAHLPDPVEALKSCTGLLRKDGELLLETGHTAHLGRKEHPRPYRLPDHLSFANSEIVAGILERIGFEVISMHFYRYSLYPRLKPKSLLNELWKLGRRRTTLYDSYRRYFPRDPRQDMFIRARLRN